MEIVDFNRWFLALFFASVAAFYVVRVTFLAKKTQETIMPMGPRGSLHFFVHLLFRVFRATIFLVCCIRVWWQDFDVYLGPMPTLWQPWILLMGDALMLSAMAGIVAINLYMRDRWRSGIPESGPDKLITSGPYRISRNPMMMLVMWAQLGFFLALPSYFSLVCFLVGVTSVVTQSGLEQVALAKRFGAQYAAYCSRTPKWLFGRPAA